VRFPLALSAASGLVVRDDVAYVVADDGWRLQRYRLDGTRLTDLPAGDGAPEAPIAKPTKPDFEALLELADGHLLALGSGSRPNRERGLLCDPDGGARPIDLAPLYHRLRSELGELDVEGAVRWGGRIALAHRGVGRPSRNALVWIDEPAFGACESSCRPRLSRLGAARAARPRRRAALAHGPRGPPEQGLHFLAAAEDTDDAYRDGPCTGSVIGRLDAELRVAWIARLRPT
jgi:hypothetical protein